MRPGPIREDDAALLAIFPRIYIAKDADPDPLTSGIVLRKSQSIAATRELEKDKSNSLSLGKVSSFSDYNLILLCIIGSAYFEMQRLPIQILEICEVRIWLQPHFKPLYAQPSITYTLDKTFKLRSKRFSFRCWQQILNDPYDLADHD